MNDIDKKRLGIFVFYDSEGIVNQYVLFFLKQIKPLLSKLVIVCNGMVNLEGLASLRFYTNDIFVRENKGFDAMAVKQALIEYIGWKSAGEYNEIVIMNDTFFGPFFPLKPVFDEMSAKDVDLWGLLLRIKGETENANTTLFGAFFYVMSRKIIQARSWKLFWENMDGDNWSFSEVIEKYEYQLIPECEKAGCKWDAYWRSDKYTGLHPQSSFDDYGNIAYELIKYHGYPFLKRKPFSQKTSFMYSDSSTLRKAVSYIDKYLDYDADMIWENILRKYDIGDIKNALQLTHVFQDSDDSLDCCKFNQIVVVIKMEQKEWVEDYLCFIKSISKNISVYILCEDNDIYQIIKNKWKENRRKKGVEKIDDIKDFLKTIQEFCRNYKLLLYMDDSFLADHNRSIVTGRTVQNTIHQCMWKNDLLISAIIDEFQNTMRLGVGILPCFYHNIYIRDFQNSWDGLQDRVQDILRKKKKNFIINKEFCINNKPVFWVRSNILISTIDLLDGMEESPRMFSHILGRVIPYIAQMEGYYTEEFLSSEAAEVNLSNMQNIIKILLEKEKSCGIQIREFEDFKYIGLLDFCNRYEKIFIYGSGVWGKRVLQQLKKEGFFRLEGFVVSDGKRNIDYLEEYRVYEVSELEAEDDTGIIVAIRENQQPFIEKVLKERKFRNVFYIK